MSLKLPPPDEPTTPRLAVLPDASRDELPTLVPQASQLEEIEAFCQAFVEPIFAEDNLDVPEQNHRDHAVCRRN